MSMILELDWQFEKVLEYKLSMKPLVPVAIMCARGTIKIKWNKEIPCMPQPVQPAVTLGFHLLMALYIAK